MLKSLVTQVMDDLDKEKELVAAAFQKVGRKFSYNQSGGAPLLGIDGICIIGHGSSDGVAITNALKVATTFKNKDINARIIEQLALAKK